MRGFKRRDFLKTLGIGTASISAGTYLMRCRQERSKPNIVLIMADDFGYECLSCNGGASYRTPSIDALAATGVRFTHCYSQPLCTPSRVQLMTGKYNFRNYTEFGSLRPNEVTCAHLLKGAGYKTCVAGKWQLAGRIDGTGYQGVGTQPEEAGFDEHCLWQVKVRGSRYWNPVIQQNGELLNDLDGAYGPDVFVGFLNDFVKRNHDNPFFVYYPMALTHNPFLPTPDSNVDPQLKEHRDDKYFGDMVSYTDKLVGRIVENLKILGLRERTLVLFTGDNGTHRRIISKIGDRLVHGGKGTPTDAGTHVPLIANWPGTSPAGRVCDDLIDFTDILPTLLAAASAQIPEDFQVDGRSFFAQIRGKRGEPRDWIYCYYEPKWGRWKGKTSFVRDERYKLYEDGRFFDLQSDPLEENSILLSSANENYIAAINRLKKGLESIK